MAVSPDLEHGIAPLTPPAPCSSLSLKVGLLLLAVAPDLGGGVAPINLGDAQIQPRCPEGRPAPTCPGIWSPGGYHASACFLGDPQVWGTQEVNMLQPA